MDSRKIFVNIFKIFLPNQKTSKQTFENIKKYERIMEKLKVGSYNQSFKDDSELVSFDVARKEVLKPPG